ncbi:MAG: mechanosensitive ion channel [Gammaproteobacteria bacterium]
MLDELLNGATWLALGWCALAAGGGAIVHRLAFRLFAPDDGPGAQVAARLRAPLGLLLPVLAASFVLPAQVALAPGVRATAGHALGLAAIGAATWLAAALIDAAAAVLTARHDVTRADNLEARRVHTQVLVLERTLVTVVVIIGVAAALMSFPRIREIGASLLVSAGVAGLAIGLAARPVLENLIAGLQLAFTQPIRVDDVVIVESEWGRIEEITATYVVVRIWDDRRLIVPFAHFISQPFQNWTRRTADILGSVFLHVDYAMPLAPLRAELERLCSAHPLWDGRVCVLQVTGAGERTVELRALVSASDAARAWDLRVAVREGLVTFLQREYPDCLPRARVSLAEAAHTQTSTSASAAAATIDSGPIS